MAADPDNLPIICQGDGSFHEMKDWVDAKHVVKQWNAIGGSQIASYSTMPPFIAEHAQVWCEQGRLTQQTIDLALHTAHAAQPCVKQMAETHVCWQVLTAPQENKIRTHNLDIRNTLIDSLMECANLSHFRYKTIKERKTALIDMTDSTGVLSKRRSRLHTCDTIELGIAGTVTSSHAAAAPQNAASMLT